MIRSVFTHVVAALACLALTASSAPAASGHSSSAYQRCAGSFGAQGQAGNGFHHDIRAKRISCRRARSLTRQWVLDNQDGHPFTKTVGAYRCRYPAAPVNSLRVVCESPTRRRGFRFEAHP